MLKIEINGDVAPKRSILVICKEDGGFGGIKYKERYKVRSI